MSTFLSKLDRKINLLSDSLTGFVFVVILACTKLDTSRDSWGEGYHRNAPKEIRYKSASCIKDLIFKPAPDDLPYIPRKRFESARLNIAFLPRGEERVIGLN